MYSNSINKVLYPSTIFRLEKHEIYPYERFAYNAMKMGSDALPVAKLPDSLTISFDDSDDIFKYQWLLNAGIMKNTNGDGFEIITTSFTPVIIFAISHSLGLYLFNSENEINELDFRKRVIDLGNCLNDAIILYKQNGLTESIRALFNKIGLGIYNFSEAALFFDLTTQFIVNHEIAHAYVGQLTSADIYTLKENRAFEFIVDLIATEWLYNKMIRNTPNTDEYREFRGFEDHNESIIKNTMITIDMQINTILVFAFAGALITKGKFTLEGGTTHPHALSRYGLQMMHLTTLVLSNYKEYFSEKDEEELDNRWTYYFQLFIKSGLISNDDIKAMTSASDYADLEDAIRLIGKYNIIELKRVVPFLELLVKKSKSKNTLLTFINNA